MLTKESIHMSVASLPEKFTIDEVIEQLILLDKVEQGKNDVAQGNVYSTEEAKKKLNK